MRISDWSSDVCSSDLVELTCRADAIPQHIEIDLAGLEIGDGVHISTVKLPEGVHPTITDRDFTIATIVAPTVVREETAAEQSAEGAPEDKGAAAKSDEDCAGAQSCMSRGPARRRAQRAPDNPVRAKHNGGPHGRASGRER